MAQQSRRLSRTTGATVKRVKGTGKYSFHGRRQNREDFRKRFKPGDIITGNTYYKGMPLLITAIGERRFLFINVCTNRNESVCMIERLGQEWRHWNESEWPDQQYRYAVKKAKEIWDLI